MSKANIAYLRVVRMRKGGEMGLVLGHPKKQRWMGSVRYDVSKSSKVWYSVPVVQESALLGRSMIQCDPPNLP